MDNDITNLDDVTKKALHIDYISDNDLLFEGKYNDLSFFKYDDGDIGITIEETEINSFILKKEQIDVLLNWINKLK